MINVQDFKNGTLVGNQLVILVDDVNEGFNFGYTKSIKKVSYNVSLLKNFLDKGGFEEQFASSKEGLTMFFPMGRYITILKIKKDKSDMSMMCLDFRINYSDLEIGLKEALSDNAITQLKMIKYEMEEHFDNSCDIVILDTTLEPSEK